MTSFIYINVLVNVLKFFFELGGEIEGKRWKSCPFLLPKL